MGRAGRQGGVRRLPFASPTESPVLLTYKSLPCRQEKQLLTAEIAETSYSKTQEFSAVSALSAVRYFCLRLCRAVFTQSLKSLDKELILAKVRIMSKITSKLQVTLPKALADRLRIRPGDEIDWQEAGDALRVLPRRSQPTRFSSEMRLRLFDEATQRQRRRQARRRLVKEERGRGWTREELHGRGRAD
jgi:AbrB family looped-hinge helix DNA binding protein